jgi:hypothetical protein
LRSNPGKPAERKVRVTKVAMVSAMFSKSFEAPGFVRTMSSLTEGVPGLILQIDLKKG